MRIMLRGIFWDGVDDWIEEGRDGIEVVLWSDIGVYYMIEDVKEMWNVKR